MQNLRVKVKVSGKYSAHLDKFIGPCHFDWNSVNRTTTMDQITVKVERSSWSRSCNKTFNFTTKRYFSACLRETFQTVSRTESTRIAKLKKIIDQNIIEPALAECAAWIPFAPTKNGKLLLCVDHWSTNAVTKRNAYPIPYIGEFINL